MRKLGRPALAIIPAALLAGGAVLVAAMVIQARSVPAPLTPPSARASSSATATPASALAAACGKPATNTANSDLAGTWMVQPGSVAGYRAHERLAQVPAPNEAVARTDQVGGWGIVEGTTPAALQLTQGCFAVDLRTLVSQDSLPGFKMSDRDDNVRDFLHTDQHPVGILHVNSVGISSKNGSTVSLTVAGQLEVNGITKPATFTVDVRRDGSQISVAGKTVVIAEDYQIELPKDAAGFIDVDSHITIEFAAILARMS